VLVKNEASPPYSAVMSCEPAGRVDVVKVAVAVPATTDVKAFVPNTVEPSLKVTVPVGVPPEPVTVAVNVMELPSAAGLAEEAREVVVAGREPTVARAKYAAKLVPALVKLPPTYRCAPEAASAFT
jgi:hypothetical protein